MAYLVKSNNSTNLYPQLIHPASSFCNEDKCKTVEDKQLRLLGNSLYERRSSFSDVTLVCNGGEIQAHRNVLSASCSYFDAMFRSDLKESKTGRVDLREIDVDVMEIIVKFLYTGLIEGVKHNDLPFLKQLLSVSHLMQISPLILHTSEILSRYINCDNYLEFSDLALKYGQSRMIDSILDVLDKNYNEFVDGVRYVELSFDQMSNLLRSFVGKYSTDKLVRMVLLWVGNDSDNRLDATGELLKLLDFNGLSNSYLYELTKDKRIIQFPEIVNLLFDISVKRLRNMDLGSVRDMVNGKFDDRSSPEAESNSSSPIFYF